MDLLLGNHIVQGGEGVSTPSPFAAAGVFGKSAVMLLVLVVLFSLLVVCLLVPALGMPSFAAVFGIASCILFRVRGSFTCQVYKVYSSLQMPQVNNISKSSLQMPYVNVQCWKCCSHCLVLCLP